MSSLKGKVKRDLSGMRFGRLTVLDTHIVDKNNTKWLCRCDCGKEKYIYRGTLLAGESKSCGCLRKENSAALLNKNKLSVTHGMATSKTYHAWQSMKVRCTSTKFKQYKDYGGRGITVCQKWLDSFEAFYADMGDVPKGFTLDRKNNDLGYSAENCRWADRKTQQNNRRNNVSKT